jgi:peptidoglycan/LPS O-acetylase OafA/YrhL
MTPNGKQQGSTSRVVNVPRLGFVPALDGMRAFAVFAVLGAHSGLALFRGGDVGVDVFFVISGFLITTLILEEQDRFGRLDKAKFWMRRLVRLTPPLLAMVVFVTAFRLIFVGDASTAILEGLYAASYTTNLRTVAQGAFPGDPQLYLGHTWSLAVEEQFYLFWPLVLGWAVSKKRRSWLVVLGLLYPLLAVLGRWWVVSIGWPDWMQFPALRFEGFAVGLVVAFWLRSPSFRLSRRWCDAAWVVGLAVLVTEIVVGHSWRARWPWVPLSAVDVLATGAVLVGLLRGGPVLRAVSSHRTVAQIGKMSYSIYLWHLPIFVYVNSRRFPGLNKPVLAIVEFMLTMVFAAGSYYLIERRLEPLRNKFRPVALSAPPSAATQ